MTDDDTLDDETVSLLQQAAAQSEELDDDPKLGEAIRHLAEHYLDCQSHDEEEELSAVEEDLVSQKQAEFQSRIFENV